MWSPTPENRFRAAKYSDYFGLLDRNGNGVVDLQDFQVYADRVQSMLGLGDEDATIKHLHATTLDLWSAIRDSMGREDARVVRHDELVTAFAGLLPGLLAGGLVPDWASRHARAVFAVLDLDRTGDISRAEFDIYLRAMGSESDVAEAFARLEPDERGRLDLSRIEGLYREWVLAGAPEAAGNVLMTGRLPALAPD